MKTCRRSEVQTHVRKLLFVKNTENAHKMINSHQFTAFNAKRCKKYVVTIIFSPHFTAFLTKIHGQNTTLDMLHPSDRRVQNMQDSCKMKQNLQDSCRLIQSLQNACKMIQNLQVSYRRSYLLRRSPKEILGDLIKRYPRLRSQTEASMSRPKMNARGGRRAFKIT